MGSEAAFPWHGSGQEQTPCPAFQGTAARRAGLKSCSRYSRYPLAPRPAQPRAAPAPPAPQTRRDGSETPAGLDPALALGFGRGAPQAPRPAPRSPLPPAGPPGCPSQPPPWHRRHPTPSDTCAARGGAAELRDSGRGPGRPHSSLHGPRRRRCPPGPGRGIPLRPGTGQPPLRARDKASPSGPGQLPAATAPRAAGLKVGAGAVFFQPQNATSTP